MSPEEIVRTYVDCFKTRDRDRCSELLGADFTFTSPYDDHIDKTAYFERCWPGGDTMESFDIEDIGVSSGRVFMRYTAKWPDKPAFRNVEVMTVEDGRMTSVEVYFGSK